MSRICTRLRNMDNPPLSAAMCGKNGPGVLDTSVTVRRPMWMMSARSNVSAVLLRSAPLLRRPPAPPPPKKKKNPPKFFLPLAPVARQDEPERSRFAAGNGIEDRTSR